MVDVIERLASAFADNRIVRAIGKGLINLVPFVLAAAICTALLHLPIEAYQTWLAGLFGGRARDFFELIGYATLEVLSIAALFSVIHSYALEEPTVRSGEINSFLPMFTGFACYIVMLVWDGGSGLLFHNIGRNGLFFALLVALTSSWLFFALDRLWKRVRPLRPSVLDTNLEMRSAFRAVFPAAATLVIFAFIRLIGPLVIPVDAIGSAYYGFISDYLIGDGAASIILTVIIMQLLWFFGAHGSFTILDKFPTVSQLSDPAATAFATQDFYLHFVTLGGSGATIGLLIALFIVGSRHRGRLLAKASLFPSLFNVNEIFLYGVPVILNPFFFFPFLLAPLLSAAFSYCAFSLGWVPPLVYTVDWTTPVILSGYLATGSIAASLLQIVCVACSVLIYIPFILSTRKYESKRRTARLANLQEATTQAADDENIGVLARNDEVGETAREVSASIYGYFEKAQLPFYLVYQPKTDRDGRVMGMEALVRWNDSELGSISPVVLVELCDENGLTSELGRWITKEAIGQYARWKADGLVGLHLSVNLNARHLKEDDTFPAFVADLLAESGLTPGDLELEITEHIAMHANDSTKEKIGALRDLGISLSIDDMGIGYSSLTYISDFGVTLVKLDISLVSDIENDRTQQEIVRSLVRLAKQLDLTVVVEGTETKGQVDALVALGVDYFQGYYFSKPLEAAEFEAFVRGNGIVARIASPLL